LIARSRLEDLILARLSVRGARPLSPADLAKAMEGFLARELSKANARREITDAVERLRRDGHIEPGTLGLTKAGVQRLCTTLGLRSLPKARDWREFKRKHLVRFFEKGGAATEPANLGLTLVARKLGLPERSARSEASLANAWLARTLKLDGEWGSPFRMRTAALATSLNVPLRPKLGDVMRICVKALSGARTAGAADVAEAMAARWLAEGATEETDAPRNASRSEARAETIERLVEKVRATIRGGTIRRFGSNKIFIASVWERLQKEPELSRLGEAGFKTLLVTAHQQGALTLARADLVAAMDPADVAASETRHLNSTYHFILDRGE